MTGKATDSGSGLERETGLESGSPLGNSSTCAREVPAGRPQHPIVRRLAALKGALPTSHLARRCGVHRHTLGRVLSGRTAPTTDLLLAVAVATGTSLDWLVLGEG